MPKYWYDYKACNNDPFQQSICVEKKPYFMTYVYDDYRKEYNNYIAQAKRDARRSERMNIDELSNSSDAEHQKFMEYYSAKHPFGMGQCAMNRICWYIESTFKGVPSTTKKQNRFNHRFLMTSNNWDKDNYEAIRDLCCEYIEILHQIKTGSGSNRRDTRECYIENRNQLKRFFRSEAVRICPDADERTNIILDLCYGHHYNNQFMWDCAGKEIVGRLEAITYGDI